MPLTSTSQGTALGGKRRASMQGAVLASGTADTGLDSLHAILGLRRADYAPGSPTLPSSASPHSTTAPAQSMQGVSAAAGPAGAVDEQGSVASVDGSAGPRQIEGPPSRDRADAEQSDNDSGSEVDAHLLSWCGPFRTADACLLFAQEYYETGGRVMGAGGSLESGTAALTATRGLVDKASASGSR